LIKDNSYQHGKKAGNGYCIWSETLYDFYMTRRLHNLDCLVTYMSGSRMASMMREFGELDAAKDKLEWADGEAEPKQVLPADMGPLFEALESCRGFFKTQCETMRSDVHPVLQKRLPYNMLPEKFIVHDPWNTLSIFHGKPLGTLHCKGYTQCYMFVPTNRSRPCTSQWCIKNI
jgi:hypothetical protein